MNAAIFAAPIPAVYLSPQAISPLSASTTPIALNLPQRIDIADPAGTTSSKLSKHNQNGTLLSQRHDGPAKVGDAKESKLSDQVIVLDGKVDVYA